MKLNIDIHVHVEFEKPSDAERFYNWASVEYPDVDTFLGRLQVHFPHSTPEQVREIFNAYRQNDHETNSRI